MNNSNDITVNEEGRVVLPDGTELCMTYEDYRYMKLLQDYVSEIMLVIDKFCKENDITYYLGEGTLLGAVRHKGFIPWDDDADLLMPREDYEKFLKLAQTGLPDGYCLDCVESNPTHWSILSYVQLTRRVPYVKERLKGIALYNGPCVDIFPLDYVPEEKTSELKRRARNISLLRRTLWIKSGLHHKDWYRSFKRRLKYYYPLRIYGLFRTYKGIHKTAEKLMTKTNGGERKYFAMFSSLYSITKETHEVSYFGEPKYTEFSGHLFPIPQEYDKILRKVYGDYMALPPVDKRRSKHYFKLSKELLAECDRDKLLDDAIKDVENFRKTNGNAETMVQLVEEKPYTGIIHFIKNDVLYRIYKHFKAIYSERLRDRRCALISEYKNLPIEEKTVLYDAFAGLGVLDSPRAIFKRLLEREEFSDYTHVFGIDDLKLSKANTEEFENLPNVKFVKRGSKDYVKYLTVAKYIIANSSVPQYFARRDGQVYLNTWHGVPSKVMGYERPGQRVGATKNIVHNFLNATHIIAANEFTGERMFKKAYMLDGIYEGKLLSEPLPRTDLLRNTKPEYIDEKLKKLGIKTDKKIILYAPTWKGNLFNEFDTDVKELKAAVNTIKSRINTDEYEVYLRVHYFLYRAIMLDKELRKICIPFTVDTDELLSAVDVLISDYSSIFFDFLGIGRPILFYVPDLDEYRENRGLYIPMDQMPGPVSTSIEGICDYINDLDNITVQYKDKYEKMREWCCKKEDGNVCDRVIDSVFLNKSDDELNCKNDKEKLLVMADWSVDFYGSAALNKLFSKIDYEKYDVTLLTSAPKKAARREAVENINRNVRILVNNKVLNLTSKEKAEAKNKILSGDIDGAMKIYDMKSEWRRLVGDAEFSKLLLVAPKKSVANWLVLAYSAPIKEKVFVRHDMVAEDSLMYNEKLTSHFDEILTNVKDYKKYL